MDIRVFEVYESNCKSSNKSEDEVTFKKKKKKIDTELRVAQVVSHLAIVFHKVSDLRF
jgi:hypothetical protein